MSIFGQVWVYSAAAFVLGVFLTWLFLVRPARRDARELRRRLADAESMAATRSRSTTDRDHEPRIGSSGGARSDEEPVTPMSSTRYIEPLPPPERGEVTQHIPPAPSWPEQDSLRAYRSPEPDQEPELEPDFASVLDPGRAAAEDEQEAARHVEDEPEQQPRRVASLFQPASAADADADADNDAVEVTGADVGIDADDEPRQPPAYAFSDPETPASDEVPVEQTQVLPKRQPRQALRGGFEPAQPIEPSIRPIARRDPEPESAGGHSGSLFEPTVPPKGSAQSSRETQASRESPPGPFGPGSAMPRPGGARPSDDYTVKASVTALRYCTEDSPQFPRMVAEVWFRTPADAERVGFRPLG